MDMAEEKKKRKKKGDDGEQKAPKEHKKNWREYTATVEDIEAFLRVLAHEANTDTDDTDVF